MASLHHWNTSGPRKARKPASPNTRLSRARLMAVRNYNPQTNSPNEPRYFILNGMLPNSSTHWSGQSQQ